MEEEQGPQNGYLMKVDLMQEFPSLIKRVLKKNLAEIPDDAILSEWSKDLFLAFWRPYYRWHQKQAKGECYHVYVSVRIQANPDCDACGGSGVSYWSDGISGSCLLCRGADGSYEKCRFCDYVRED